MAGVTTPGSGVTAVVAVGTQATAVVATNTMRKGLYMNNPSTNSPVYYGFGTNNAATSSMHVLATSSSVFWGPQRLDPSGDISISSFVPIGDLSAIIVTTTAQLCVTEW